MDSTGTRHNGRAPYQVTTPRPPGTAVTRTGRTTDQIQGTKPVTTRVSPASRSHRLQNCLAPTDC